MAKSSRTKQPASAPERPAAAWKRRATPLVASAGAAKRLVDPKHPSHTQIKNFAEAMDKLSKMYLQMQNMVGRLEEDDLAWWKRTLLRKESQLLAFDCKRLATDRSYARAQSAKLRRVSNSVESLYSDMVVLTRRSQRASIWFND